MSLLQNEDFVLYQLRTSYLSNIKDGVGERLINVNSSVLNNPAFRAGGWITSASDIKRTYSPPIPTAITSEYFQAPRSAGLTAPTGFGEDEEEGGLVTGGGSTDTVGPSMNARRRRRREQLEEDDSSDLSDESDEETEGTGRPLTQIKFTKMPVRNRAGSSPLRSSNPRDGPSLMITSPSRPPESGLRRGSLGALEAVKERARRDTVTSSEMSSENELDSSVFQRKQIRPSRPSKAAAAHLLSQRIAEDERENEAQMDDFEAGAESDGSSLSSGFVGSADSGSFLGEDTIGPMNSSPPMGLEGIPSNQMNTSPKKPRQPAPLLQALPPPRPISMLMPVSALTQALKAKDKKPESPFQRFAVLSGEGDPNPLWIKIYAPFSQFTKAIEMPLKRRQGQLPVITGDAIGLALYKYNEEGLQPPISADKMNVNHWVFRMYEDGEVEEDFPPITRTKPITDFTSNNNRTNRGRARDKPWDEFALVQASASEFKENEQSTPAYTKDALEALEGSTNDQAKPAPPKAPTSAPSISLAPPTPNPEVGSATPVARPFRNPVLGLGFAAAATYKSAANPLDAPDVPVSHATPRTGAYKTITINFTDDEWNSRKIPLEVTTDTYIAEVFETVCHKLGIDKALFVLKVTGTATIAPADRTVEALGQRSELDLARRRFMTDGAFGLSGSPGSSSPNAPLFISTGGTHKKSKKGTRLKGDMIHPLAQKQDAFMSTTAGMGINTYKRFAVTRKQPMSFSSSSSRILALDGEYMHILPSETGGGGGNKALFEPQGKTTVVPFSSVVGSKVSRRHPRMFRVVVYKERETKRYDFEAGSTAEAQEIVKEIKKAVERFNEGAY